MDGKLRVIETKSRIDMKRYNISETVKAIKTNPVDVLRRVSD